MTRFICMTLVAGLVGCGDKDDCDDTAAGACDTGVEATDDGAADDGAADDGAADDGAADDGAADDGAADDGAADDGSAAADMSCSWGATVCVEANEPDNEAWCTGVAGTPSAEACADGSTGTCALPAGGDYTAEAMAYYYGDVDGETACANAGGAYTAADAGGDDDGGMDDTGV